MERKTISMVALTDDDDGVCASQSKSGSGALTLNGALVSSSVATLAQAQKVTITSAGNDSGITFTITGTDADGVTISNTITGGNATTATGTKYFKTVTGVSTTGSTASTVKVGTLAANGGVSATLEVDVNKYGDDFKFLISAYISGAGTFSVEASSSVKGDTFSEGIQEEGNFIAYTGLSALTASAQVLAPLPAKALRFKWSAYTSGTARVQVLTRSPKAN